jgi:hypothetical protein
MINKDNTKFTTNTKKFERHSLFSTFQRDGTSQFVKFGVTY